MERFAGRVILLWGWRRALTAFAAGAFGALAQAPFDFPAAFFISFPVLVWLLDGACASAREGLLRRLSGPFLVGWWFGFGYFVAGLWWVGNALLIEGEFFAWAWPLAVIGLPALLALFYGIATLIAGILWSDGPWRLAALALGFFIGEWLRSFVLTGFPWNAVGYAAMPVPMLMQSITVIGMAALNALAVLVFAAPALLAQRRGRIAGLTLCVLLLALHAGFGWWRMPADAPGTDEGLVNVRLVQPSIEQSQKWDAATAEEIFQTYVELSMLPVQGDVGSLDLIIWPETAVPFLFTDRPDALVTLGEIVEQDQLLLAGAVRVEGDGSAGAPLRYYNSIIAVDDGGEIVSAYDKVHLVPFGEYVPFAGLLRRLGVGHLVASAGPFEPGNRRNMIEAAGTVIAPFICYEIIFPGYAGHGGIGADFLLNVTNDAWFGLTPGPYQHFRQAQLRAVEAGRPLVRAANNGISGVVDAYGRIVDAYDLNAVGVIDIAVPARRAQPSLAYHPAWNGFAVFIVLTVISLGAHWRRREN